MEEYLKLCHENLKNIHKLSKVKVVVGNEACDLDSAVCSLATGYHLTTKEDRIVLPIFNIPRQDLNLHTEVVYFLNKVGVPPSLVICRDEIDLKALHQKGILEITLVDHNQLPASDSSLESSIVEIIDHHQDIKNLKVKKVIEPVGSCATLVAERIMNTSTSILDPSLSLLLYGTILLDTVCLSEEAKRVTSKDIAIATSLKDNHVNSQIDQNLLFEELERAKADISGLTTVEVLNKDLKVISENSLTIALSSIPILLDEFCNRPSILFSFQEFAKQQNAHALVLLGLKKNEHTSEVRRQLGVYSNQNGLLNQIVQVLQSSSTPSLQLTRLNVDVKGLALFEQANIAASRKIILPVLQHNLHTLSLVPTFQLASCEDEFGAFDPLVIDESYPTSPRIKSNLSSLNSSAQNSCPYTPQNSYVEDVIGDLTGMYVLPSFNNKDMVEKIKSKREKLGAMTQEAGSVPFTPHNSFVESSISSPFHLSMDFDTLTEQVRQKQASLSLNALDTTL